MTLESDLEKRDHWRRYLRERSLETLAARFGISTVAVWLSEIRSLACLTDEQNAELKALRKEYNTALHNEMPKYRLVAIARRNGVTAKTVSLHQQHMIMDRAQRVYERGCAV